MRIWKRKKQAVKKRCDKKESRNQYKNQKYLENLTSKVEYQKVKYQENPDMQMVYKNAD